MTSRRPGETDLSATRSASPRDVSPAAAERVVDRAATCAWCRGPIPPSSRRDALTCSTRCRQARHRFITTVGVAPAANGGQPRRLAYADPPYPGKAWLYKGHPDYAGEVDHADLVSRLSADYDAWALSTSAAALPAVLAVCPPGVMVAAWHRGERPNRRAARPLNAWEPVIYGGAVALTGEHDASRGDRRRVDSLVHVSRPRLTDADRVIGAKPATFCRWLFELLGATPGDELVDIFPGSGGVARAWAAYTSPGPERHVAEDLRDVSRCTTVGGGV